MMRIKNTNKKTAMGGVGIALLLCILMALSPMTGLVQNETQTETVEYVAATEADDYDYFALPDVYEPAQYEYDETSEIEGMRSMNQKAFRTEDGKTSLITASEPLHYLERDGSWDEIDLSVKATVNGWEVTENNYQTSFPAEVGDGVAVTVHPNVDPIITGMVPMVMTIDMSGGNPMPFQTTPSHEGVSIGGNMIRYPIAEGFDLDYTVETNQVKQNLVIRERPVLDDNVAWFGLAEQLRLPVGHALYLGDDILREDLVQTQEELSIRNTETGEIIAVLPVPVVMEMEAIEPYHATYFVQVFGQTVVITTAVESSWLLDEDRQFPLAIDPTIKVTSSAGGYCYVYYAYCYNSTYRYLYRYYSRQYYMPWNKYTFTSANALPTGASVDQIDWKQYVSYGYSYSSNAITAVVMESCGTSNRYSYSIPTASCSGLLTSLSYGYGGTTQRKMISSLWNSAAAGTYATGTGWKTSTLCSSSGTACSSSTGSHAYITNALANSGSVGMGARYTTSTYMYTYAYTGGNSNSYIQITYSGGSDTTAPTSEFVPYTGITSYKEGERTFFSTFSDMSGIDTTSTGQPVLYYSVDNGSYSSATATTIGTCGSTDTKCQFSAQTADIKEGEFVNYYWAFQDLASTPNTATDPSGGSGSTAPSTTYWFFVGDVDNAGTAKKFTTLITDRYASSSFTPGAYFDQQMTYYDNSNEYVIEFDTSSCGTGSSACFYTSSYYFYSQWKMMWTTSSTSGYNGMGGTKSGDMEMHKDDGGFLTIAADDGPGMNLIYLYDSSANDWAMVGLGTGTGIDEPLSGGTSADYSSTYGYTEAFRISIPGDFTGTFGKFDFNATYSSSGANWMCVGSNGWYYFFRSTSSSPRCTSGYYYIYSTSYRWAGMAFGSGYYGRQASSGDITYKVGSVAPEPDTYAPEIGHDAMRDSHARDRTFSYTIGDAGDPPAGLNVNATAGEGPTLYYRTTAANGTVGNWTSKVLSPSGKTRAECILSTCTWTTTVEKLERNSTTEYKLTAEDNSTVGGTTGTSVNKNETTITNFSVGDPNKMFIVEWHDLGYTSSYTCNFQVVMYDVTNEIEFQYDTNCQAYYDYATVGYQDQTRTMGATLQQDVGYMAGGNPFSNNYRIATESGGHSSETFDLGMTELPTYDTAIIGSSNGRPYGYYCVSSYYWNTYKAGCNANIDLPDGFTFDYFGTEYDGSDSKNRVHIGRMGNMYLKDDGSTSIERSMTTWYSNMPDMPYSGNSMSKPGNIAPWWGYYSSYYCYDTSSLDCSVRTRIVPFEGKGTDISADITQPTTWSLIDSPIRINPSNDYLSIGHNLTIDPGVVVQVASGKGLSFDGACNPFIAVGNSTDHIVFEGQNNGTWKGLAFTGACSATDDRHMMSYVDFADTTDAAIAAGSRHGATPSSNANVGNFTMDHITFTDVGEAFAHGSGQGTVLTLSDFEVTNAANACFNFAEDTIATLTDGEMNGCNDDGTSWGGAVVNYPGSTAGALIMENVDISNSQVNLIDVDLATVWISNVTGSTSSAQSGTVLGAAGDGTGSSLYIYNMDADGYSSGSINSLDSISMNTVDWGSADIAIAPGGTSSTAAGPAGSNAVFDTFTSGDLTMARMAPMMDNIDISALTVSGNAPGNDAIEGSSWSTEGISINGCGYKVLASDVSTDWVSGSCSDPSAPNTIVLSDVTGTYTGTQSAIYARNSDITIGEGTWTMPTSFDKLAKASTDAMIVLIAVSQDGTDCDGSGACDTSSGSSGDIYFGGLATVKVYKLLGSGVKSYRSGHTVQATVVDAGAGLFTVGTHRTDSNGEASVWVIAVRDNGDTYADHNLAAWGPAGQNETLVANTWYPGSFEIGDSIELRLEPAPVALNGTNMDCSYLESHPEATLGYDSGTNTFTWEGKITMSGDLTIDSCTVIVKSVFRVASDATNNPILTIGSGGVLEFSSTSTDIGTLQAVSASYPLHLDMDGGTLIIDNGVVRDLAANGVGTTGGLVVDSGTVTIMNGSTIYGNSGASNDHATIWATDGTFDFDDSTIINVGQTGMGLLFTGSYGTADNIVVKNADVGIASIDAAPAVNGFNVQDSTSGVSVYGGMSLPTIYRSTLLSGQSTGWTTYDIDMSGYLGDDYLQVGLNSIYAGGNAHPSYNYYSSKYYMIYDRMRIELTDGTSSWNVTYSTDEGYVNGGGWDCNYYGYTYNPDYDYGYYYYMINYGGMTQNGSYNEYPSDFGFRWEAISDEITPTYAYPMHYWGYYSPSSQWTGVYAPPEGFNGMWGSYNVCLDYAATSYVSSGQGARTAYPVIDISGSNITGVTMYVDVLHNRADNYQDRLDVVARSSDDVSELGNYARESGTPSFANGQVTGADTGLVIGGSWAAVGVDNVTVSNPITAGLLVDGSVASSVNGLTVEGGNYGVLMSSAASGSIGVTNATINNSALAGVYYIKDVGGDFTGTITNSASAGIKFGTSTSNDLSWTGMNLGTNAVGVETAGSGALEFIDSTFGNVKDFVITGSANVDFIEGNVDATTVEVTGSGTFDRMRQLDVNVEADASGVVGANVLLMNADGLVTGTQITDASGDALDLLFTTISVNSGGLTNANLAGYQAVTVAKIGTYSYTNSGNSGDFRYGFESVSLSDASDNSATMDLVDNVDSRVCYGWTSSYYVQIAPCAGSLSTSGSRTYTSGLKEYGYYGGSPADMSNQVIMADVPWWYMDGGVSNNFNESTILNTGGYTSYETTTWYSTTPYGGEFWMHDGEVISLAVDDDGTMQGVEIGYFYGAYLLPNIQNSTLSGIASIASSHGYKSYWSNYNWEADMFTVKDSTITHFRSMENTGSVAYEDMCFIVAGSNVLIEGNTISNCAVGVFLQRTPYYYYHNSTYWGADDAVIKDNDFKDTETIDIWFYIRSYNEGTEIIGNTFSGSSNPSYSVYTQDSTTSDLLIDGNTFLNADEPIYMRGATDWTITDNVITGKGDAALAGIYVKDGHGVIDGNTMTDADGGLLVDGVKYGFEANITNNNIGQTAGRIAPAAVGIWAEDCGSSQVNTGGNNIEVMENAIVTDGCDLTDSGSTLTAIGGTGGSVSSVQVNANAFAPASLNIDTGDTIRWRANEYYNNSGVGEPHTVTSNDTDSGGQPLWGSAGSMNLGSTYTRTFNTVGTYEYHCATHNWMSGVITVANGTSGTVSSVGFSVAGGTDEIVLDGTTISGFGTAIEQYGGDMTLTGGATLNGGSYGAYAEDTDVIVDDASLSASSTGSALYVRGTSSLDAANMDTAGLYGINTDAVDFRWNYGNSVATTAVMADGGAEGSVENVTWAESTNQIDAGSYVTITSVGNSLDANSLIIDPTAVIHEGNLLNLNVTRNNGGDASDVGLMIKSTDSAQAAYVSPAYRTPYLSADGDLAEWTGNVLNPSDDAMPGVMSGDGSEDFLTTWDANNLYMALTGVDMASADLQIYIDSSTGGETTGQSWYVAHSLPFAADYVYWAEDGTGANSGLKVNGFTGWADVTSSCSGLSDYIGNSANTNTEIAIPWDCIGSPSDTVRIIVVVQNESDGGVASVHPDQTLAAGNDAQSFNDEITLMMGHSDLTAGDDLRDHLLIFRSYVGSNSPSDAKTYDLSVLVDATCEKDWGLIEDVDMSTNTWAAVDIERACPAISDLVDITVNEDSGAYVLTLLDKATDIQDDDVTLTWSVSDDLDPTNSPSMLLDSALSVASQTSGQTMTITPDNDQFGTYRLHYTVTDSNGLSDDASIWFTVVNVNDAPIICNDERTDCMPVFVDDGAGNLNVLDEGFGSISQILGSSANGTIGYITDMASNDMANEQPQVYTWGARIKGDDVTVDAYWVQKKYTSVAAMFDEVSAVITANGAAQDLDMTGDPSAHEDTDVTYTLPTLNNVSLLTYLLAQNGCGSVWYQEYMDTAGNKVSGIRSDDGCDSTIDTYGNVYSGLNYTQFWETAYGVDVSDYSAGWSDIFADGYSTTAGNNPCVAFGVTVNNNELVITEDASNELGGECTIVLTLSDDGGYCANLYMGRTTNAKASCVAYTWLVNYPVNHPVYGPITVTGCYNIYLGLASFIPEYYPSGQATGMTQGICLAYSWNAENNIAEEFEVNFSVTPVNDAPEVLDWDRQAGVTIVAGNGTVPNFPWKVTLTEDDETAENLVYDLSAMKADNDHADDDLVWSIVKSTTCDYEKYFSATINGDEISFDLIKDATTNAPEWEVDYLNDNGEHQATPESGEFCPITLFLHDSATAPAAIPNYGMTTADYQQGEDSATIHVRVNNVAENVPDYFLKDEPGFDFNGVTNVMTKTYVPTTVKIGHGGDEGPYNYDHMLQVTFMTNGYNNDDPTADGYVTLGTQYVSPPAYGEEISVSDDIFVTSTSTTVWAKVDVLTCVDATCDMSKSPDARYFGHSFPEAHRCLDSNDVQGEEWSCPGTVGRSSLLANGSQSPALLQNNRRPMLEDQAWCNNLMSSDESGSDCAAFRSFNEITLATDQDLPTVVRLIGTSAVPSFAPSLIAISAAGLFVSALVLQSRREEEGEALEEMSIVDDETAVSPVIATILMVAITVVLSGVIYVWAASLAQVDTKGVPRMTFTIDSTSAIDGDNGHHRIAVSSSQVDLATQAIDVRVQWSVAGELSNVNYNLANPAIYGFGMDNTDTDTMVTFVDSVDTEKGATKSTFNTGDTIFIRTVDADGNSIEGMTITITYNPGQGQPGAVLRQWNNI